MRQSKNNKNPILLWIAIILFCIVIAGNFTHQYWWPKVEKVFKKEQINGNLTTGKPTEIQLLGSYKSQDSVSNVFASGKNVYLVNNKTGLQILDVSNVSSPLLVGEYKISNKEIFDSFFDIREKKIYLAQERELEILNVSDITKPIQLGTYRILDSFDSSPELNKISGIVQKVRTIGKNAYLITEEQCYSCYFFEILNTSYPTPVLIGRLNLGGRANDFSLLNQYAYLADWYSLDIIDISNPADPKEISSFEPPWEISEAGGGIWNIAVVDKYSFLGTNGHGLQIVDISDINNPVLVGSYTEVKDVLSLVIENNYLYLAGDNQVQILDISNPVKPVLITSYKFSDNIHPRNIFVDGKYIYVAAREAGLQIFEVKYK